VLINNIYGKYKTISIVGMAKNSGKTVALNHLIGEAFNLGLKIGILSTGRDGESVDVLTETEKPRIFVEEGTIVVTTSSLLSISDATVEIMKVTDYRTPLGNILIGKVKVSGYLQISGPQTAKDIKDISNILIDLGADMVIIDGAIDRKFSAAPSISEATILATGAVLSRDMNRVIEETAHLVNLFKLPSIVNSKERKIIEGLMDRGEIAIIDRDLNVEILDIKTALSGGRIIGESLQDDSKYIVITGSLINKTLEDIILTTDKYKNVDIVISDGTKVFISPKDWIRYQRYGINVKVLYPINLVAVTLNPFAPQGYYFDPEEFLSRTRYYVKDIPVVDLMLGGM
jgi:hypothetical protein